MGAINSKISFIQKQCKSYSNVSAEGLMYGIANIMTMKPDMLAALFDKEGYENKEMFVVEQRKTFAIIKKVGLDLKLIKKHRL